MKTIKLVILLITLLIVAQSAQAQSQKEKDRVTFINNTRLLSERPFDPNAPSAREWGFKYVADTDEVTVTLCSDAMKFIPEKKNKFKAELLMQFTFEMAVFKMQHPDKRSDETAANIAGLEGMLRTYKNMVAANEKAKNADLDALLVKQANGELKTMVEAAKCKSN